MHVYNTTYNDINYYLIIIYLAYHIFIYYRYQNLYCLIIIDK